MDMTRLSGCKSSSQELVLDDENLLTLILLRLPCQILLTLKSVSKQWHSLIASPHFTRLRPLRASGLIMQSCYGNCFVPLDDPDTPSPFRTLTNGHDIFDPRRVNIRRSCNGLLLCSVDQDDPCEQLNYYVYNPSTNQLAMLPEHHLGPLVAYVGLAFDPSKSLHYKVIAFVIKSLVTSTVLVGDFHIYSSATGTWRISVRSFTRAPGMYFKGAVYWHGCIHWLVHMNYKSETESFVSDCLYFNVDEGKVKTFPSPPIGVELTSERSSYFGQSEDHLHFIEVCPNATSLSVYEMKSDYSEWFVKYQLDLAPISKVFPEMTKNKARLDGQNNYAVDVLSLIRRENFQEDSFLVLKIPGKTIRYNLIDRSFKVIWDFAVGKLEAWQYIETLSCV
ncbi:putative F-box family protein [Heracleum sosnowskyi]|uniref:F-box family protein n=1 Tax=Heracleum sosnowskyi TaxID=360622 RepID=A0AAD8M8J2_9APIA|nr:putative F-box family protein [Heracleum sosnowskyi]